MQTDELNQELLNVAEFALIDLQGALEVEKANDWLVPLDVDGVKRTIKELQAAIRKVNKEKGKNKLSTLNSRRIKIQNNYISSVREVLAELSVQDEDDDSYLLTIDKSTYDRFLNATAKALKAGCAPLGS